MAVDSFMLFQDYKDKFMASESQVDFSKSSSDKIGSSFLSQAGNVFEVESFSFDVEQTINMSSQAGGAGAGKINFGSFKVTRKIDKATSQFFLMACRGTTFKKVSLGFRKSAGVEATGLFFLRFDFGFVALKTISWSHDEESPKEDLEFEYGQLGVIYGTQAADGSITPLTPVGWDKIKNVDNSANVTL